jgi:hypothetical protein
MLYNHLQEEYIYLEEPENKKLKHISKLLYEKLLWDSVTLYKDVQCSKMISKKMSVDTAKKESMVFWNGKWGILKDEIYPEYPRGNEDYLKNIEFLHHHPASDIHTLKLWRKYVFDKSGHIHNTKPISLALMLTTKYNPFGLALGYVKWEDLKQLLDSTSLQTIEDQRYMSGIGYNTMPLIEPMK